MDQYEPVYFDEFLSTEEAGVRHWKLKKETHKLYKTVKPNIGHYAIRDFEKRGQLLGLITQNIDGLHSLAGVPDDKIVELHGTDRLVKCLDCHKSFDPDDIYGKIAGDFRPPVCDHCGGFLKSANVSFGQPMPAAEMQRAQAWSKAAGVFIVIGSSLQIQPAVSFPVIAKRCGALLAIVNREPTPLDDLADFTYHDGIGEFVGRLAPLLSDG